MHVSESYAVARGPPAGFPATRDDRIHRTATTRHESEDFGGKTDPAWLASRLRSARPVTDLDTVPLGGTRTTGHRESGFSPDSVVVGRSPRMRAVFDFLGVIAGSESNVLIIGETGTGKEVIARLIHHSSARRSGPFVAVELRDSHGNSDRVGTLRP